MKRRTLALLLLLTLALSPAALALGGPAELTPGPAYLPPPPPEPNAGAAPTKTVTAWVDGAAVTALREGDRVYLPAGELQRLWPWFTWGEEDEVRFTDDLGPWLTADTLQKDPQMRYMADFSWGQVFLAAIPKPDLGALKGRKIPILMYHAVSDDVWGIRELFVSPKNMAAQLDYLNKNGYQTIFFSDLAHIQDYDKPVLLTFDDGYRDNYKELFPLLKKYNAKATIFMISDAIGSQRYLTAAQVSEMADSGLVDIQSHTVNHLELAYQSAKVQTQQLSQSKLALARATRRIPYVISYPNGSCNQTTKSIGPAYYDYGVLKNGGIWSPSKDLFGVTRQRVNRSSDLKNFARLLK